MIYILMGVSGSGKTTVGKALADKLMIPFFDADDFHTSSNIIKMKSGLPLNDEDRMPWLNSIAENMLVWEQTQGAVLACSALKESYREVFINAGIPITWIFLDGDYQLILERLENRKSHFFNPVLLKSQCATLEPPKYGLHINLDLTLKEQLNLIIDHIK
jgi:carbohydrate kinase (thermoresistant glucokinase family)